MPRVLRIKPQHVLPKVIELLPALAERIHLAQQKIEQRVVAVQAAKIEHPIILVMVLLHVSSAEEVHAKSQLVLAARDIYIVGALKTSDVEDPQGACATTDSESAIADGYLQEVFGTLINILHTQRCGIDSTG